MSKTASKKSGQPNPAGVDNTMAGAVEEPVSAEQSGPEGEPTTPGTDNNQPAGLKELQMALEEARAAADAHWDTVLRTRAEIENLRKRSQRDLENAHKFGVDRFISEMLPVKDSLELGLAAAGAGDADVEKVREGMELTLKMFSAALEKLGVSEVNPEGQGFNPEFHQAMTMQEAEGQDSGTVISVIQKGYLLNERLVRPALVVVAK